MKGYGLVVLKESETLVQSVGNYSSVECSTWNLIHSGPVVAYSESSIGEATSPSMVATLSMVEFS